MQKKFVCHDANAGKYVSVRIDDYRVVDSDGAKYELAGITTAGMTDAEKAVLAKQLDVDLGGRHVLLTRERDHKARVSIPDGPPGTRFHESLLPALTFTRTVDIQITQVDYGVILIWQGLVRTLPDDIADAGLRRSYLESERAARAARRGIWSEAPAMQSVIRPLFPPK